MIMAPMTAGKKWSKNFIPFITVILLVPLAFMWFLVPCKSYVTVQKKGGLTIEYEKVFPRNTSLQSFSASAHSSIAAMIFGCSTFLCNVFILVTLLQHSVKRLERAEKTLLAFEALLMVTTMMYAITQVSSIITLILQHPSTLY
ncbi:hypothetical protein ANCDUO_04533 [Ancylostoma duodenale]|uniref:Serpentine receptor class gamma n=1 Tax=Ancylostoma duodenale TaxID=51022 RepID=A0A0C2DQZ2_9BILA|nr:hypothetical protein ANCDUO_04533 [Ancylostoma duodenale]